MPFFCKPVTRSVALSRPRLRHQPAPRGSLRGFLPRGRAGGSAFSRTRRPTDDGRAVQKKKHMKTTSQKKSNRLPQESKLSAQAAEQPTSTPQPERVDTRLPIDTEARKQNRTLPTEKVLALLQQHDRRLWEMAEVVGKWIWICFSESPAPTVRQTLAQLGFHWNRTRQAWQHPCGQFRLSSAGDPHEKYPTYNPADVTTN